MVSKTALQRKNSRRQVSETTSNTTATAIPITSLPQPLVRHTFARGKPASKVSWARLKSHKRGNQGKAGLAKTISITPSPKKEKAPIPKEKRGKLYGKPNHIPANRHPTQNVSNAIQICVNRVALFPKGTFIKAGQMNMSAIAAKPATFKRPAAPKSPFPDTIPYRITPAPNRQLSAQVAKIAHQMRCS